MVSWHTVFVVAVAGAQLLALGTLAWMGLRLDRYLRESQRHAADNARAAGVTLEAIHRTQQALGDSAATSNAAATALAEAARRDETAVLAELLEQVGELHTRIADAMAAAASAGPAGPGSLCDTVPANLPAAGLAGGAARSGTEPREASRVDTEAEMRRILQLQGEAAELRRRLEEREREVDTLGRERRRFAQEAAQLAGAKAMNERLMAELKDKRHELRELRAAQDPVHMEVKSLRSALAALKRQVASGPVDGPRLDGTLVAQTRAVFEERLLELETRNHALEDELRVVRDELLRAGREKAFVEEHYLDLAQA